jgi:hypothetical protein
LPCGRNTPKNEKKYHYERAKSRRFAGLGLAVELIKRTKHTQKSKKPRGRPLRGQSERKRMKEEGEEKSSAFTERP